MNILLANYSRYRGRTSAFERVFIFEKTMCVRNVPPVRNGRKDAGNVLNFHHRQKKEFLPPLL